MKMGGLRISTHVVNAGKMNFKKGGVVAGSIPSITLSGSHDECGKMNFKPAVLVDTVR